MLLPKKVGSFTLVRKLDSGAGNESYLGILDDPAGKQVVARRVPISPDSPRFDDVRARAQDLMDVQNAALVPVLDLVEVNGEAWLLEEWIDAVDLSEIIDHCHGTNTTIPHTVYLKFTTQICNGLEALHARAGQHSGSENILHLAIAPESILVKSDGQVLLGSYGLFAAPAANQPHAQVAHLSPEQTQQETRLTPASDIFSLGAVLYELLTLREMFRAESHLQTIHRIRRAEVTTQLLEVKEILPGLDKVLFRALSLNPRHRYQRAFVLREDLRGLMAGFSFAEIDRESTDFLRPLFQDATLSVLGGDLSRSSKSSPDGGFLGEPPVTDPDPLRFDEKETFLERDREEFRRRAMAGRERSGSETKDLREPRDTNAVLRLQTTKPRPGPSSMGSLNPSFGEPIPQETTASVSEWGSTTWEQRHNVMDEPELEPVHPPEEPSIELRDLGAPPHQFVDSPQDRTQELGSGTSWLANRQELTGDAPTAAPSTPAPGEYRSPIRNEPPPRLRGGYEGGPRSESPPDSFGGPSGRPSMPPPPRPQAYDEVYEQEPADEGPDWIPYAVAAVIASLMVGGILCLGIGLSWNRIMEVVQSNQTAVADEAPIFEPEPEPEPIPMPEPEVVAEPEPPPPPKPPAPRAQLSTQTDPESTYQGMVQSRPAPKPIVVPAPEPLPPPEPEPETFAPVGEPDFDIPDPPAPEPVPEVAPAPATGPLNPQELQRMSRAAFEGQLSESDRQRLEAIPDRDPSFTQMRTLLYLDAKARDDVDVQRDHLARLMARPENKYNPVLLVEGALDAAGREDWDQALAQARQAELHWARLPSDLVFSRKALIYEIKAVAHTGRFYASEGESLNDLNRAIREWQNFRRHVNAGDRPDLVDRADKQIKRLTDIQGRLE